MMGFGGHSEVGAIGRVLLKHPRDAFKSQAYIDEHWRELGYTAAPEYDAAVREYDQFAALLKEHVEDVQFLPQDSSTGVDSIYVRDAAIMTDRGAILCNMGKDARRGEPAAVGRFLGEIGVPVLGEIGGDGRIEGGDLIWIDDTTLAVGRGYRSNDEGIRQLTELTRDFVGNVITVPLPHWRGPSDVFHLMSIISPIDRDLALVYSPLLPVPFREWLIARGIELLEVPEPEFETMGCNVLALSPRKCLMLEGNDETRRILEEADVEVLTYVGDEISRKGAGGPTCLTRPILRLL
jgi:arginine deiminase